MRTRKSSAIKLSGTVLALYGLAGCGSVPQAMTPPPGAEPAPAPAAAKAPAASVSNVEGPVAAPRMQAVPREIVVKLRNTMGMQAVANMQRVETVEGLGQTSVYEAPEGQSVEQAIAKLRQDPSVIYAEPNYLYRALGATAKQNVDDPMMTRLWGLSKIEAPAAWETTSGDPNVLVAVVDTGVDYLHPDLQGQVVKGPDFGNNDADPMDDQGHGTHVAGTIAAIGNNGTGVVGVAYKTKVLAIKVLGSDGSGDTAAIAKGILKAQEMGAKVINLSLGGEQDARVLKDAVDQVTAKGVLCVVAAGNENTTRKTYPAAYPNVLSVGASDKNDSRASFSNYGTYVDIAAPGTGILSSSEKDYKSHDGTSMASPHAAGVAALLLAQNAELTPSQLKAVLESSGDKTTGFPEGVQRLNAKKALEVVQSGTLPAPKPEPTQPAPREPERPDFGSPDRGPRPQPGRPMPGRPIFDPGRPMPGQPMPGRPMPGQPMPGQPMPGQPMPGQPMPYPGPGMPFDR